MGQLVEQEQTEPADVFQLSRDNLIVIVFATFGIMRLLVRKNVYLEKTVG